MISIVVCSTNKCINSTINDNIIKSIGTPYELIFIDNSCSTYSIFSAYNEGIKRAKYKYICFIHEDIIFRTLNWGHLIVKSFEQNSDTGLIGVIGAKAIYSLPYGWWSGPHVGKILQNKRGNPFSIWYESSRPVKLDLSDAVVCDGLFMAINLNLIKELKFDDINYKGFHAYDMDICMKILDSGYKVKVINNILIEHFSCGNIDHSFIDAMSIFYAKWHKKLPIACDSIDNNLLLELNTRHIKNIYDRCCESKMPESKILKLCIKVYSYFVKHKKFKYPYLLT